MNWKKIFLPIGILLAICLLTGFFYGITTVGWRLMQPTFPKENIGETLREICRQDYGIDCPIQAKINNKTLGVQISVEGLFGPPERKEDKNKAKPLLDKIINICELDFDSQTNSTWVKLYQPAVEEGLNLRGDLEEYVPELKCPLCITEKAKPIVRKFLQAVRRLCVSLDTPLDFCIINLRDPDKGLINQVIFSIDDLKKTSANWISGIDFSYFRDVGGVIMDSKMIGNELIQKAIFLLSFKEKNLNLLTLNAELKSVQVSNSERLYYLQTANTSAESITTKGLYVLINTGLEKPGIEEIYTADQLPENLVHLRDVSCWQTDDLYVKDVVWQDFFTEQIALVVNLVIVKLVKDINKAHLILYPDKKADLKVPEIKVDAKLLVENELRQDKKLSDPSENTLELLIASNIDDEATMNRLLNLSLWAIKNRCQKYDFFDFSQLKIIDGDAKEILTIKKQELFKESAANADSLRKTFQDAPLFR